MVQLQCHARAASQPYRIKDLQAEFPATSFVSDRRWHSEWPKASGPAGL